MPSLKDLREKVSLNTIKTPAIYAAIVVSLGVIMASSFWWGLQMGKRTPYVVEVQGTSLQNPSDVSADFGTFWQAWRVLNENYLRYPKIKNEAKVQGAIKGLVESMGDPYTQYFSPDNSKKFQEDVDGSFGGVGVQLGLSKDQLVVIAPMKGTPGDKAGLLAGDFIMSINGSSTDGMSIDEAVSKIRGPQGTKVKLSIFRGDWDKIKDFEITRATIETPTIDYKMLPGNIAHVSLYSFNANADRVFYDTMVKASRDGAKGLILDLRNNPGGYLEVAVNLAGWFVDKGKVVVTEEGRDGQKVEEFKASGNEILKDFPVAVLINKGSASASEILAGALRDIRKTKLVGEQSFGKGTVQVVEDLRDGSSIKVTVAHWVLPSGHILENGGLKPDIEAPFNEEDARKGIDAALDKAVEAVKGEMRVATQ